MPRRWTIKELKEISALDFAIAVLNERLESTTNPYTPLVQKIHDTQRELEEIKEEKKTNFPVLRVSREDVAKEFGTEFTMGLSDEQMEEIALEMAEIITDEVFWETLRQAVKI